MKNVIVYDRKSNEELGEFLSMPDNEEELKRILEAKLGQGSYRLRWKERGRGKDGKMVAYPRQRVVRCLAPLELSTRIRHGDDPGSMNQQNARPVSGNGQDSSPFLVQLILQRIDANQEQILNQLNQIRKTLEEEPEEPEEMSGYNLASEAEPSDLGSIFKSIATDPAYSGLVGSILTNASNPEKMAVAIQEEMNHNPALLSGLVGKLIPILMGNVI